MFEGTGIMQIRVWQSIKLFLHFLRLNCLQIISALTRHPRGQSRKSMKPVKTLSLLSVFCVFHLILILICPTMVSAAETITDPDGSIQGRIYTAEDFVQFLPRNAQDMLNRVPGFSVVNDNQGRGLGQAGTNVLINGKRVTSKSQDVFDQLQRLTVENVERIEIVDGSTLELPGLTGQVANVITRYGGITGRYRYRTQHRPKYAEPLWFAGEVSVTGGSENIEWNAAYNHGAGRGGAGGPGIIRDVDGNIIDTREVRTEFVGDFPRLSGSMTWNGPNNTVANLNVQYRHFDDTFSNDELRRPIGNDTQFRDFDNSGRGHDYEIGGDIEFGMGPGTLKLIGLERAGKGRSEQLSKLVLFADMPSSGSRFLNESNDGERIVRSEYRWGMLGGDWEVDLEAAFNYLDRSSQFFSLQKSGEFEEVPLPNATGEVTEDRYEILFTHSRDLGGNLNAQLTFGGEQSALAQSGPRGLTRHFWRNKGSLNLGWTPDDNWDISLNVSRRVGQLSFGDFLASVSLAFENANAGNVELRPTQQWETTFQLRRKWGEWGTTNLRLYDRRIDDYIEIIPINGGGESRGNIDEARLYGMNLNSTIDLDPLGRRWQGIRLDFSLTLEESEVIDPLSGLERDFSGLRDTRGNMTIRHDVPGTDWAWGFGAEYNHALPSYRLFQLSRSYDGPWFTFGFIEHKDIYGLTVNMNVFNITEGQDFFERTVYDGFRTNGAVLFTERRDLEIGPTFRLQITGNF